MSDYPADIMENANSVFEAIRSLMGEPLKMKVETIASSLLAERESFEEVGIVEKAGDHLNVSIDDDLTWAEGEKLYRKRVSE